MASDTIDPKFNMMVQTGSKTDKVEVAPQDPSRPTAKPWAHFLAGGYCGNPRYYKLIAYLSRLIFASVESAA